MHNSMQVILAGHVADNTLKAYAPVIKKLHSFCVQQDYSFPFCNEMAAVHFLAFALKSKEPVSFFGKVTAAMKYLGVMIGAEIVTPFVSSANNSIKRQLAKTKPPVKKAPCYSVQVLIELYRKIVQPFEDDIYKVNGILFRSLFRATIMYFTFCRFSDFNILYDGDFEIFSDYIRITFRRSKNDQFYRGSVSIIPKKDQGFCPYKLTISYFQRFHLKFGRGNRALLNFRLKNDKGFHSRLPGKNLSVGTAVKHTKNMLKSFGFPYENYSEKAFKVAGVTALYNSGESLEHVMIAGRWHSLLTPMHYRDVSDEFKQSIVEKIPN